MSGIGVGADELPWRRWLPGPLARRPLVVVLALSATVLAWGLGGPGLWESTEARYAEVASRMVRDGDWLVPRLDFAPHHDKPPLAYWTSALGMAAVGIGEAGARLGSVLMALAVVALTYAAAGRARGPTAGAYAALALVSAPLFFALARSVSADVVLALCVVGAAEAGRRGSRPDGARGWRLAAWLAIGAGFLAKGPVVLVWTAAPALAWTAWTGRWSRLRRLADPLGAGLAAAVALPWYVAEAVQRPGLLAYWLGDQTLGRAVAPFDGEADPWWASPATLAWAAGPWIVPAALELGRAAARGPARGRWLVAWVLVPLALFSLFPTKRANHLLPLVPPIAIAAGGWWAAAAAGGRVEARAVGRLLAAAATLLGIGLLVAGVAPTLRAELPAPLATLGLLAGSAFVLGGGAAWVAAARDRSDLVFAALVVPILGLHVSLFAALARPEVERWAKISRPLALATAAHRLGDEPIVAAWDWPRAFPFYLDERVVTVGVERAIFDPDSVWRGWILPDEADLGRFAGRRAIFFVPRGRRARLETLLGEPVTVLAATRRHLLATNRPTAAERATTDLRRTPARRAGPRPARRSDRSRGGR